MNCHENAGAQDSTTLFSGRIQCIDPGGFGVWRPAKIEESTLIGKSAFGGAVFSQATRLFARCSIKGPLSMTPFCTRIQDG
jgi:hypothetical protein